MTGKRGREASDQRYGYLTSQGACPCVGGLVKGFWVSDAPFWRKGKEALYVKPEKPIQEKR